MRVVLDTNLLISGLISVQGFPARLLDAWDEQRFELVSSKEQLDELRAVSRRPRLAPYIDRHDVGRFINQLQAEAMILVRLPHVDRSADPADNFLLGMAEACEADYLVSGDKRGVLALKRHGRTHIVTARMMVKTLGLKSRLSKSGRKRAK
jgi:putative PIN family toxin of toxin-antitoxin system